MPNHKSDQNERKDDLTIANTGNASNPPPENDVFERPEGSQLLGEKAEKYLREVASIEDLPDAQDQEAMDRAIEKNLDN